MDRRTALERLDAVRPGSDDLSAPEMADLRDVLSRDDDLRAEFDRRKDWDRGVATAFLDIPVPAGLKGRLLTRLAASEAAAPPKPTPIGRRRLLTSLAAMAVGLAAAVYWVAGDGHDPVTVAQARDAAAELLTGAEEVPFAGRFTPPSLDPAWTTRLRVSESPSGVLDENGEHRAAAWRVSSGGRAHWHAVLVAIPVGDVVSPPEAGSISDRDYVVGGKTSGLRSVRWTADGFVFVLVCPERDLDSLIAELETARLA